MPKFPRRPRPVASRPDARAGPSPYCREILRADWATGYGECLPGRWYRVHDGDRTWRGFRESSAFVSGAEVRYRPRLSYTAPCLGRCGTLREVMTPGGGRRRERVCGHTVAAAAAVLAVLGRRGEAALRWLARAAPAFCF